ncbi:ABC transporter permease [Desulfoplanes sp.]
MTLTGPLDRTTSPGLVRTIAHHPTSPPNVPIRVDMRGVTLVDDFGALVLMQLAKRTGGSLVFENVPEHAHRSVSMVEDGAASPSGEEKGRKRIGWIERLGAKTIHVLANSRDMLSFVGDVLLSLAFILRTPCRLRGDDTLTHMQRVGADALPIVGLISFLLGLIMAFMSAVQLEQFGANIYVASLVSLSMVRELGPIMTAIIVAGRSGSAFAAEIGSMRVAEEIDALTTMGFDTTVFLVLPRVLATVIVQPLLTLFSDLFAVAGGLVVGVTMLDLTTHGYMVQTIDTISVGDVLWSMLKTMLFALLIAGTGCFRGFQVRGGADAVGRATTSSVVTSIFLIILADSILAVIQRYWG